MKILFLIPHGSFIACGAVRVLQYLPYLERNGIGYEVIDYHHALSISLLKWEEALRCRNRLVKEGLLFISRFFRGYFNRFYGYYVMWKVVKLASSFDIIFSQRVLLPKTVCSKIKSRGSRLVFDFDDAVFLDAPVAVEDIVQAASAVISGSHFTDEYAAARNPNSFLIPSSVPIHLYRHGSDYSKKCSTVTIGWIGSSFTLHYLKPLLEPLKELQHEGCEFELLIAGTWGATRDLHEAQDLKIVEIPFYGAGDLPDLVQRLDIGLMPLADSPWEKGKCAMKALLYMAGAKPTVCSPVGEVLHIIDDGVNGYFAGTAAEWKEKLKLLIDDSELRQKVGLRGRATVENDYSTEICFDKLEAVFKHVVRNGSYFEEQH